MEVQTCVMDSFAVVGKEGSTNDGKDFVQRLWKDANDHFSEVADLAKKDEQGNPVGFWGAMSDFSHSYKPWEDNFTKGLYLAGVEVKDEAEAPKGWVKWVIPTFEYLYVQNESPSTFSDVVDYLNKNEISLVGAVQEFNCPETGHVFLFFPIRRL